MREWTMPRRSRCFSGQSTGEGVVHARAFQRASRKNRPCSCGAIDSYGRGRRAMIAGEDVDRRCVMVAKVRPARVKS